VLSSALSNWTAPRSWGICFCTFNASCPALVYVPQCQLFSNYCCFNSKFLLISIYSMLFHQHRFIGLVRVSASVIFPCTIKSRNSFLAPAHPDGPGKMAVKRLWCGDSLSGVPSAPHFKCFYCVNITFHYCYYYCPTFSSMYTTFLFFALVNFSTVCQFNGPHKVGFFSRWSLLSSLQ